MTKVDATGETWVRSADGRKTKPGTVWLLLRELQSLITPDTRNEDGMIDLSVVADPSVEFQ